MASFRPAAIVAVLCAALLLLLSVSLLVPTAQKHFLGYTEDSYKVAFVSGNFSAAVTRDMPRVVFWHTDPVLSPEFDVSCRRLYLFNDTNHDGIFSPSEAVFTSELDSHHVTWTVSPVEFVNESAGNGYAHLWMRGKASLSLSAGDDPGKIAIPDWATVSFEFRIYNRGTNLSSALGSYAVAGRTEMPMSMSIELLKHIYADGIVLETYIHGGGSTDMLQLRQAVNPEYDRLTNLSVGVDESRNGSNFTHRFMELDRPVQDVNIAKDDGTVQAFYHFGSAPVSGSGPGAAIVQMNSSYFTDGAGLVLHQAFFIAPGLSTLTEESSLGINERGFNVGVGDWFQNHLAELMVVFGAISAAVLLTVFIVMYRRYRKSPTRETEEPPKKSA